MWGLLFPWGTILIVAALVHFVRTRPDGYWLWIIIMGGPIGAVAYLLVEAAPDVVNIHRTFRFIPRNNRIKELRVAILDNPAPGNYEELGDLYREAGKAAEAREAYNHAITSRTDSPHPFYGRALASLDLNDPNAAIPDLERTLALDPQHDYNRALGMLAVALTRAGQMERAALVWNKAIAISTASEIQYEYALFLRAQGRNAEAREWAQRVLAKKATLPRYLKRRERPWFRKAASLLKSLPRNGSPAHATVA
jgi:hypothetical protein